MYLCAELNSEEEKKSPALEEKEHLFVFQREINRDTIFNLEVNDSIKCCIKVSYKQYLLTLLIKKNVNPKLIDEDQTVFVSGRHIEDKINPWFICLSWWTALTHRLWESLWFAALEFHVLSIESIWQWRHVHADRFFFSRIQQFSSRSSIKILFNWQKLQTSWPYFT